jgi:hypothetical protein
MKGTARDPRQRPGPHSTFALHPFAHQLQASQLASLEHRQAEEDPSGGDVGGAGDGGGDDRAVVPDPADGDADAAGPRVHGAGARARHEPPRLHPQVRRLLLPRGPPHQQVQEGQPLRPGQCLKLPIRCQSHPTARSQLPPPLPVQAAPDPISEYLSL